MVRTSEVEQEMGSELIQNLRVLWESGQHSDLVLEVEGSRLQVHCNLLSARSPVFQRMLESNMSEAKTRVIKIVDVSWLTI